MTGTSGWDEEKKWQENETKDLYSVIVFWKYLHFYLQLKQHVHCKLRTHDRWWADDERKKKVPDDIFTLFF